MTYWQQGDLLIKAVSKIPSEAKKTKALVLIEGEHSGHAHRIQERNKKAVLLILGAVMYLRAYQDTPIEHEEHNTIILPPGDYKIDRVREYDHFLEEVRAVAD